MMIYEKAQSLRRFLYQVDWVESDFQKMMIHEKRKIRVDFCIKLIWWLFPLIYEWRKAFVALRIKLIWWFRSFDLPRCSSADDIRTDKAL